MNAVITKIVSLFSTDKNYFTVGTEQPEANVRVIHNDHQVVDLEKYLSTPRRIEQSITLYQLESFTSYIAQYAPVSDGQQKHGNPVIFVSLYDDKLTVKCSLDYHKSYSEPTHCSHKASLSCERDKSFTTWVHDDNSWMSQTNMVDLLKKNSNALTDDNFPKLLQAIEKIKSETNLLSIQKSSKSESNKSVYFETLETFEFNFKPYCSIPKRYSVKADLYIQLDDNNRIQLKYSIRNPSAIYEQVASDLRDHLNETFIAEDLRDISVLVF